jgi:peptide-methionine (S)-S-oxide reductase
MRATSVFKGTAAPLRIVSSSRSKVAPQAPRVSALGRLAQASGAGRRAQRQTSTIKSLPAFSNARCAQRTAARVSTVAAAGGVAGVGDYVEVHYTGTLDDGTQFDSSHDEGREPLNFKIGEGRVVPGFEQIATGMSVGEVRKERISPDLAYGEKNDNMTAKVPVANAPEGLTVGATVQLQNGMQATVTAVDDEFVEIDANHPLAGKALTFEVELVNLVKSASMQVATFGAGCFWSVELNFQRVPGVVSTSVGYSQGHVENPTYEQVCSGSTGHNEVVQVTYDSNTVTFEQLLDSFFSKHDPTTLNRQGNDVGDQYRSGIYYHTEEQKVAAEAAIAKMNEKLSGQVVTELEPVRMFTEAEDYHQQYLAKGGRFNRPQSAAKGCNDPIRCYG